HYVRTALFEYYNKRKLRRRKSKRVHISNCASKQTLIKQAKFHIGPKSDYEGSAFYSHLAFSSAPIANFPFFFNSMHIILILYLSTHHVTGSLYQLYLKSSLMKEQTGKQVP